jgi:copper chaperone NosL
MIKQPFLLIVIALFSSFIIACSEQKTEQQIIQQAVKIESADECHLCGMLISGFDGPKGELYNKAAFNKNDAKQAKKFCSTRDMFAFYLDPENKRNVSKMFVHDMSKMPWDKTNDSYFIDAKQAWYVINSDKTGAMGKTLASFSRQKDANAFAQKFHGSVVKFEQITLAALQ